MTWSFDIKPEAALKYFRGKGLKESFVWQDLWQEEHDASFTVAKMMDVDLLRDVREHVDRAIAEGTTLAEFRKGLEPALVKRGWWGRQEMTDPATGESRMVQLGSARRLETIFRTNMQTAYAAGDWEQITDNADSAPYLMYDAIDDNRTRPQHHAWDGTVLRWDDPWWETHRPPNGWNCRCSTIQLSDRDLARLGKEPAKKAPVVTTREYVNPRSGDITQVPDGIDPGFGYNVGKAASQRSRALELFSEKVATVPAAIGAAAWAALAVQRPDVMKAFDDGWAAFIDRVRSDQKVMGNTFNIGAMAPADVAYLAGKGTVPQSAAIEVSGGLIAGHKDRKHKQLGDGLSDAELLRIPAAIRNPEAVLYDKTKHRLLYITSAGEGDLRKVKLAVWPDFRVNGKKTTNSVRTVFKSFAQALQDETLYFTVRGKVR